MAGREEGSLRLVIKLNEPPVVVFAEAYDITGSDHWGVENGLHWVMDVPRRRVPSVSEICARGKGWQSIALIWRASP